MDQQVIDKATAIVKQWYSFEGKGEGVEYSHSEGSVLWFVCDRGDVWVDTVDWSHNDI